jgi:O-antigen/teichoic acid export membrane protein
MSALAPLVAVRAPILSLARSSAVRQAALFAGSTLLVGLLSAAAKALLARSLTPAELGAFLFATSLLLLGAILFEFGLFLPAGRAIAGADLSGRREIAGAAIVLYLPVGLAFAVAVLGVSFVVDGWFNVEAGAALRLTAALALAYPLGQIALWLAQGSDRLHLYSVAAAVGQVAFAGVLAGLVAAGVALTVPLALTLQACGLLAGWAALLCSLRPRFEHLRPRIRRLAYEARQYGAHAYLGRILSIGTYNMDVLLVAAFTSARDVALYAIAATVARVVGLPAVGLASTLFARLTRDGVITPRWLTSCWVIGLIAASVLVLIGGLLVEAVFGSAYVAGVMILAPLAFAEALRGVTTLYNSSLTAQARGKELRNAGIVLTAANLILNFALIPTHGATGAAWASFGALAINLFVHAMLYRRVVSSGEIGSPGRVPA